MGGYSECDVQLGGRQQGACCTAGTETRHMQVSCKTREGARGKSVSLHPACMRAAGDLEQEEGL
jgi:hypothetical protein